MDTVATANHAQNPWSISFLKKVKCRKKPVQKTRISVLSAIASWKNIDIPKKIRLQNTSITCKQENISGSYWKWLVSNFSVTPFRACYFQQSCCNVALIDRISGLEVNMESWRQALAQSEEAKPGTSRQRQTHTQWKYRTKKWKQKVTTLNTLDHCSTLQNPPTMGSKQMETLKEFLGVIRNR